MKQYKTKLIWAAIGAAAALMLTGCSGNTEESESADETAAVETTAETMIATETTAVTTTDPDELLKTIGEKAEGENVFAVHLTNGTGLSIVGVSIAVGEEAEFTDNLLEDTDTFAADEIRILYYDASETIAEDASSNEEDTVYAIELTFEDGTTAVLHQFPFGDIEAGEIKIEDAIAFLEYTSLKSNEAVNTKEAEVELIEAEKAAAEEAAKAEAERAEAEAAAEAEAQAAAAAAQEAEAQQDNNSYDSPAYEEVPADDNNTQQDNADPNDGCLGDEGLFY